MTKEKRALKIGNFEIKLNLLSLNNSKLRKSDDLAINTLTAGMQLTAGFIEGFRTCMNYSECIKYCNSKSGFFQSRDTVKVSRQGKTELLRDRPDLFMELLDQDLANLNYYCEINGLKPIIRLNTSSDLDCFQFFPLMEKYKNIQFYDYSKNFRNLARYATLPKNYHITRSFSSKLLKNGDQHYLNDMLSRYNLALIAPIDPKKPKPRYFWKNGYIYNVVNGDITDHRFDDVKRAIVLLGFKGTKRSYLENSGSKWIIDPQFFRENFFHTWEQIAEKARSEGFEV